MRPNIGRVVGLAILLAVLVHVDWHLGRPQHMRLSLDWSFHWLLGLAAGASMAWIFARRFEPDASWRWLSLVGVLGLTLGQIVQPALEVVAYGVTFEQVYPQVRWHLFAAFAAAWVAGGAFVLGATIWRRRAHGT